MLLTFAFGIDEDVIEVHYYENFGFLYQDLVDVTLECSQCISQSKRHDLLLKVAIAVTEGRFPFIIFPDPHLIVGIN